MLAAAMIAQAAVVVGVAITPVGCAAATPIAAAAVTPSIAVAATTVIRHVEINARPITVTPVTAMAAVTTVPAIPAAISAMPLVMAISLTTMPPSAPTTPLAHFGQVLQGEPVSLLTERDGLFWCEGCASSHRSARSVDGQADHESESDK